MAQRSSLVLAPFAFCLVLLTLAAPAAAEPQTKHHALSLIGEPQFGPDFTHFDWVNPTAPKGGRVRQWALGQFQFAQPVSGQGQPRRGCDADLRFADGLDSPDEPSTEYGLIAEWVSHPDDFSSATFQLRAGARFHDGKPVTPEDVIFSLDALKKASPRYAFYYKNVIGAREGRRRPGQVRVRREGQPRAADDRRRAADPAQALLGGHGRQRRAARPRQIHARGAAGLGPLSHQGGRRGPGASRYERVKDWWAKDLPVSKGQWNFDEIKFVYFRDRVPAFEAFKAGQLDYWPAVERQDAG